MEVSEIIQTIRPIGVVGVIIVIGSLIRIEPLKINLWSWLVCKFGSLFNKTLYDKIEQISKKQTEIETKLDEHIAMDERDKALERRQFMLSFGREIINGVKHTREEFIEVLATIDRYDEYCNEHPEFPNNRAICAKKLILDNYQERLEKADFLAEEYREKISPKAKEDTDE